MFEHDGENVSQIHILGAVGGGRIMDMPKGFRPIESIKRIDTLWSWFERFGLVWTTLIALGGGGLITFVVAWFQALPKWVVLSLVFLVSSLLVLGVFVGVVWTVSLVQKKIRAMISENPLTERILALEQSMGPRHLTDEQKSHLLQEISQERGEIRVTALNPDDDAGLYAEEFAALLREAGWTVWGVDRPYTSHPCLTGMKIGITLLANHPAPGNLGACPHAQRFADALASVGIKFHYFISYELHQGSCELIIGHRGETAY
jgi:hypothetical protein